MSVTYTAAPQVANIAEKIIAEHHSHLEDIEVTYVFRSEHAERHGNIVFGKARKVSGLNAFLIAQAGLAGVEATVNGKAFDLTASGEPFFVIEIAQDIWATLSTAEREALVDHELSHCRTKYNKDGELTLYVATPDVEDFSAVIERRGLWRPNLRQFFKAAKAGQPTLWAELEEDEDGNATIHDMAAAAR